MKEKPVSVVLCYFSNVRVVRRFGFPCVLECRNHVHVWFSFSLSIFFFIHYVVMAIETGYLKADVSDSKTGCRS
jgi:hypothetical protein